MTMATWQSWIIHQTWRIISSKSRNESHRAKRGILSVRLIKQTLPGWCFWWNALIREGACLQNAVSLPCGGRQCCLCGFDEIWDASWGKKYFFLTYWTWQQLLPQYYLQAAERDIAVAGIFPLPTILSAGFLFILQLSGCWNTCLS